MQLAVLARSVSGGALALLLFLLQRPLGERVDPMIPAAADPGNEDPNEGPPGDPPDQIGQCPAGAPAAQILEGEEFERHGDHTGEVIAD